MTAQALVLAPGWVTSVESYRLNNHISANLHYLALGHAAREIGVVYAEMMKLKREGNADWFEQSGASRYFTAVGHELYLKEEFYFPREFDLFDPDLRVSFQDRIRKRSLDIPADAPMLAWLGRLLPLLRRTTPMEQVRSVCDDDEWSFVNQLIDEGILERTDVEPVRPASTYSLRLLGHAALALQTPGVRVLFDPLFTVRMRGDVKLFDELEPPVDAVVVSHPHWDHFSIDTLFHVPRTTRMIVPRLVNSPSIQNVDIGRVLRQLGFSRVDALAPWESATVGDVCITAAPFYGEQSGPDAPQDWMTYHVRAGGRTLFGAVDSCHDARSSMDAVMREVRSKLGPVDILLSPFSCFHYPISVFTRRPFYLGPGAEQYSGGPDDSARWLSVLGARFLVPYAGFVWRSSDYERVEDDVQRGSLKQLRSIVRSHPSGPLVVLTPRKDAIEWEGPDAELCFHQENDPGERHA
jgi:L-ascorbate metabolism protein UlaG (beta-lactamase superfamily)